MKNDPTDLKDEFPGGSPPLRSPWFKESPLPSCGLQGRLGPLCHLGRGHLGPKQAMAEAMHVS